MWMLKRICVLLAGWAALTLPSYAQVARAVDGATPHLWVGAEGSYYKPDWGFVSLPGFGFYADYTRGRFGLEGEAQFLDLNKPGGLTEKSFLGGPYFRVYQRRRLSFSVKVLAGAGLVNYTGGIGYGSYLEFAPRGDVEYRLGPRFKLRGGYEHQFMPSAPGLPDVPSRGLTPHGISVGLAYHVF